ncbi:MAG: methylamine methyltransferase corrinoid protein reductive activase [Firmicutes bacterium]|nr:methylamine methyltransferase corrinoid protein reductive activase [Bacillota bacterium]
MTILRFWQSSSQTSGTAVSFETQDNITVLAAARAAGVLVESPCNGAGTCGKCKVRIPSYPPESIQVHAGCQHTLTPEELSQGIFLGCTTEIQRQTASAAEIDIFVLERQDKSNVQILSQGQQLEVALSPHITKQHVSDNNQTLILSGDAALGIEPGNTEQVAYGLVVDIGTTTLVTALFDLTTGKELAAVSELNPQSLHAQDVLSRIKLGDSPEGLTTLYTEIINSINTMISDLTRSTNIKPQHIYEIIFSGNTCMLHLALNTNPASLGKYPYTPVLWGDSYHAAAELGLTVSAFAQVYLPPVMSAYVGADITAGILAADLGNLKGTTLFVDIGTNGEMALAVDGRLSVTSTAAGPAFEGMNIACGMRAAPGAIEKFNVTHSGDVAVKTISDHPAVGICGSGLLDIVGELVRTKLINKTGKFAGSEETQRHPLQRRLKKENGKTVFAVHQSVYLSQKDVRQVQLAKGAIRAGIECLLDANKLTAAKVDRVFIAGSFGYHLNADSLINIGMLPETFRGKIDFLGNTAKTGGQAMLLNQASRQNIADLVKQVEVLELATYSDFDKTFVNCLNF